MNKDTYKEDIIQETFRMILSPSMLEVTDNRCTPLEIPVKPKGLVDVLWDDTVRLFLLKRLKL